MADTIKKIGIKNASGSGYDSRDIGAEAKNIEVPFSEDGSIITDDTTADKVKSLAQVLSDNSSAVEGKAPENHADATDKYGAASTVKYGHVKLGTGFTTGKDGETSVAYSTENTSGAAVEANDARLSDARKNPQAVTFSDGKASATTEDYDGSVAKTVTYSTVGAAPQSHASADTTYGVGSATNYGHVKAGTGLDVDNGVLSVKYGTEVGTAVAGNDTRLSDARTPKSHAATATTYGGGNASNYGHVKLTDTYFVETPSAATNGAATSIAASAYALQQAYNELKNSGAVGVEFKNITTDFNGTAFSANLDKYKPGNYIVKAYGGTTYVAVLADYNYFYNPGRNDYANLNSNHWVAIVLGFAAGQMNSTNVTTGGYKGSAMHTWCMGAATTAIKGAFGSHATAHSCLLSKGTYNASVIAHGFSWEWVNDVYAVLPSEVQIYGSKTWSDLGWSTGEANRQLELFKHKSFMEVLGRGYGQSNNNFNTSRAWLRDIGAAGPGSSFCYAASNGIADSFDASYTVGRFPLIILK